MNAYNQLVLTPVNIPHSRRRSEIAVRLCHWLKGGKALFNVPLETRDSTKVVNVVWASNRFIKARGEETSWTRAPEICIEVFVPTNTPEELEAKRALYFEGGALEVWTCGLKGEMNFYTVKGKQERSVLCPKFPLKVKL